MKIAIIELEDHAECIYSIVKVLSQHMDEVQFFLNERVYNELSYMEEFGSSHFSINLMSKDDSIKSFMENNFMKINECSILLFTTVQQNFQAYPLARFNGTKILRIHNAYTFSDQGSARSIDFDPYILWKDVSFFIREIFLQRFWKRYNQFKEEIDYFVFPDQHILAHTKENKLYPAKKILGVIPLACMNINVSKTKVNDRFKIVITGLIDQRRKDYKIVLSAIKSILYDKKVSPAFELVLLGKPKGPYGKQIVSDFNKLENEIFKVKTFGERIEQEQFEAEMNTADLLLAPIQINTRYKYFKETYGLTKQSGSISDLIRYRKPLVVPHDLEYEAVLNSYISVYKDLEGLIKLINHAISNNDKKTIDFSSLENKYLVDSVYTNMMALFQKTIN